MQEPDWAKVVQAVYRSAPGVVQWQGDLPDDHNQKDKTTGFDLRDLTDLSDEEISNAVSFATRTGLMVQIGTGMNYKLTEKGFNVAHERELRRQQGKNNRVVAAFTVIIGLSTLIQAWKILNEIGGFNSLLFGVALFIGIVAAFVILRGDTDVLTG